MTKITIEKLTEVYKITCGDTEGMIYGTENLLKEIQSLLNVSQKGQDIHREGPPNYHKKDNKPAVPVAKPGITKSKVHALLDEGLTTVEIALKLGLSEGAIFYHEKSYVQKEVIKEIEDPDKSINVDEIPDELPVPSPAEDDQITIPAPSQQQTEQGEMVEFQELKMSLPKHMLMKLYGDRKNTDKHNMSYYSNEDGGLIIQYGSNKCYTTWDDLHNLPYPIPGEMLTKLNTQSKLGVKAFKDWMVRNAVTPKTDDPDADYRPMLTGVIDTSTNYDSKLDGVE